MFDAMAFELRVEADSAFDYEHELWASERRMSELEAYNAECEYREYLIAEAKFLAGEISAREFSESEIF